MKLRRIARSTRDYHRFERSLRKRCERNAKRLLLALDITDEPSPKPPYPRTTATLEEAASLVASYVGSVGCAMEDKRKDYGYPRWAIDCRASKLSLEYSKKHFGGGDFGNAEISRCSKEAYVIFHAAVLDDGFGG